MITRASPKMSVASGSRHRSGTNARFCAHARCRELCTESAPVSVTEECWCIPNSPYGGKRWPSFTRAVSEPAELERATKGKMTKICRGAVRWLLGQNVQASDAELHLMCRLTQSILSSELLKRLRALEVLVSMGGNHLAMQAIKRLATCAPFRGRLRTVRRGFGGLRSRRCTIKPTFMKKRCRCSWRTSAAKRPDCGFARRWQAPRKVCLS